MLNDGSFQIFTARFGVRNPTGAAVNAITADRTVCADVYSAQGKPVVLDLLMEGSAIDRDTSLMNLLKLRGRRIS